MFFSHILNAFPYCGFMATPLSYFRGVLGQLCVSMFFFISGYGIVYSIDSKGETYSKSIFTNRVFRIVVYTIIALIPFFIYSACLKIEHNIFDYFLAIIGLKSFGNETWFLFAILICYLLCSIVYLFNWKNKYISAILVSIGIISYIFIMYFCKKPSHNWDTIVCFIYGMVFGLFREKINQLLSRKKWAPIVLMAGSVILVTFFQCVGVFGLSKYFPTIVEMLFANFFFCLFFVCATKIFTFRSHILSYLGKASFAIFIMHRLVICCFQDLGTIRYEWLNYLVLFLTSPLIGFPIYYVYKIADKYIINPVVEWNRNLVLSHSKDNQTKGVN